MIRLEVDQDSGYVNINSAGNMKTILSDITIAVNRIYTCMKMHDEEIAAGFKYGLIAEIMEGTPFVPYQPSEGTKVTDSFSESRGEKQ